MVMSCPYSLMDRISDSGSDGCGSIPHGGTKKGSALGLNLLFYRLGIRTPTTLKMLVMSV